MMKVTWFKFSSNHKIIDFHSGPLNFTKILLMNVYQKKLDFILKLPRIHIVRSSQEQGHSDI